MASTPISASARIQHRVRTEPFWVRMTLLTVAFAFLLGFLFLPLTVVFVQAFSKGWSVYIEALLEPNALLAARLTLLTALIAVPLNLVFGVAAAWSIAKFEFKGKSLLITLIDLPFSVSPVVSGFQELSLRLFSSPFLLWQESSFP